MAREIAPDTRGLAVRYALAGLAAALALPAFVFLLNQPLWMGLIAAAIVFVGLALFSATRPPQRRASPTRLAQGQRAVLDAVMADARPALETIAAIIEETPKNTIRDRLQAIKTIADDVVARIEAEPERLGAVQRLLTYYLPRAAEIAAAYEELRIRKTPDSERLHAIGEVLSKMEAAFAHFAAELADDDMRTLDADLKLIDAALKEDLGRS